MNKDFRSSLEASLAAKKKESSLDFQFRTMMFMGKVKNLDKDTLLLLLEERIYDHEAKMMLMMKIGGKA